MIILKKDFTPWYIKDNKKQNPSRSGWYECVCGNFHYWDNNKKLWCRNERGTKA